MSIPLQTDRNQQGLQGLFIKKKHIYDSFVETNKKRVHPF